MQNRKTSNITQTPYHDKGKVQKNKEKKLTSVSFALTHTYTPVKTNIFPFFPQAYMENLAIVWEKRKKK